MSYFIVFAIGVVVGTVIGILALAVTTAWALAKGADYASIP